jgi:hypothetical protein
LPIIYGFCVLLYHFTLTVVIFYAKPPITQPSFCPIPITINKPIHPTPYPQTQPLTLEPNHFFPKKNPKQNSSPIYPRINTQDYLQTPPKKHPRSSLLIISFILLHEPFGRIHLPPILKLSILIKANKLLRLDHCIEPLKLLISHRHNAIAQVPIAPLHNETIILDPSLYCVHRIAAPEGIGRPFLVWAY